MTMAATDVRASRTSAYQPQPARVLRVTEQTEHEKLFELLLEDDVPLGHQPGQFVQVSVLGIGECPISVCSSPSRGPSFELCVRRVGEVTEHLHRLAPGDRVGVRGPLGHGFDLESLYGKDILIVVGGLGLAPVRSLIQAILDQREEFGSFHVLYGARTPAERLFREDLLLWSGDSGMRLHVTVDRPDPQWRGKSGVVTMLFSELPPLDPARTVAVVVGPPIMFKFAVLEVLARRIPQKNILCSLERRMKCGIGKCGHCQVNQVYVCMEGPVFTYAQLKALREALT